MWGIFNSVGNAVGAMVERFVPETSMRNAHHDSVQLESDAAEQRTAHRMAFGSPSGSSGAPAALSPLDHFTERLLALRAPRRGVIENPVVYRSSLGRIHVYALDRDVFIVHAALDRYYRKRIESIVMQDDDIRADPWLLQEIRRATYDAAEERRECEEAAKCESIPAAGGHPASSSSPSARHFKPSDWIIYTRNSSDFVKQLGAALARDTVFDSTTISLQDLGGSAVSFDAVAFLCGTDATFVDSTRATDDATATATVCIDMAQTTEPGHVGATPMQVEEGHSLGHSFAPSISTRTGPQSVMLNVTLASENEWIALPVWTWTMRSNDMRGTRPLHTTSDLMADMQTFDAALLQCIQRLQSMDPGGRLAVDDVRALQFIKIHLSALDRFIGAIVPSGVENK